MRVALLTDGVFPFVLGGMQKHSWFMARYLARNGVHVALYHCVNHDQEMPEQLEGFSDEELKNITNYTFRFPKPGKVPGHYIRNSYSYSKQLYGRYLKEKPVDFIYAQGFAGWFFLEQKIAGKPIPPVGVNFHGLNMFQTASTDFRSRLENKMFKKPVRQNLQMADMVFSLGGKMSEIQKGLVSDPKKVIDIPNGVEQRWLSDKNGGGGETLKFLFIGRYDKVKGLDVLYEAVQNMEGNAFEFEFIGPIPEEHQQQDTRLKYRGKITDETKMRAAIQACDVLVVPSYSEGMPTVILEAMACGLAIIATDVGAVKALVDSTNGWLIEAGNAKALETALKLAIQNKATYLEDFKTASKQKVKEHFTWDAVIGTTIKAFEDVLNKQKG